MSIPISTIGGCGMVALDVEVMDIRKILGDGNLKAFADLKFGGQLVVKGFSVMKGRKGVFVSMPSKAGKEGRWFEIIQPSETLKREIEDKVLEAYDEETDGVSS